MDKVGFVSYCKCDGGLRIGFVKTYGTSSNQIVKTFFPSFLRSFVSSVFILLLLTSCSKPADKPIPPPAAAQPAPEIVDRIILASGGVVEGKIVEETPQMVRINWQGGIVGFTRAEIKSVERNKASGAASGEVKDGIYIPDFEAQNEKNKWPAGAKNRIQLKDKSVLGGEILAKTD
jgi:hypothetical protein